MMQRNKQRGRYFSLYYYLQTMLQQITPNYGKYWEKQKKQNNNSQINYNILLRPIGNPFTHIFLVGNFFSSLPACDFTQNKQISYPQI